MSANTTVPNWTTVPVRTPMSALRAVAALALVEARHLLRNPLLLLGLAATGWIVVSTQPDSETWPGETFAMMMVATAPLLAAISLAVARAFHRERLDVGVAAPLSEGTRAVAKLLAASPLVIACAVVAVLVAWWERAHGGLWVGGQKWSGGRTVHTVAELGQHVALALFAVALGAALGRRAARTAAIVVRSRSAGASPSVLQREFGQGWIGRRRPHRVPWAHNGHLGSRLPPAGDPTTDGTSRPRPAATERERRRPAWRSP